MDPIIEEIRRQAMRKSDVRPDVLRRWATYLCDTIQPQLDELVTLKAKRTKKADEVNAA